MNWQTIKECIRSKRMRTLFALLLVLLMVIFVPFGKSALAEGDTTEADSGSTDITATGGQNTIAARTLATEQKKETTGKLITDAAGDPVYEVTVNGSGDGTNATNISTLINMGQENVVSTANVRYTVGGTNVMDTTTAADKLTDTLKNNMVSRSLSTDSVNAYYSAMVSKLGSDSESLDDKADAQDDLILQITNWRSSTSGVDWNEELSNMIMFQKGYSACSRCLTTMDEMLDKLINSTGMVGR